MDEAQEVGSVIAGPSLAYQFGKLLVATVVAFAATKVAEKTFDVTASAIKNHQFQVPPIEG